MLHGCGHQSHNCSWPQALSNWDHGIVVNHVSTVEWPWSLKSGQMKWLLVPEQSTQALAPISRWHHTIAAWVMGWWGYIHCSFSGAVQLHGSYLKLYKLGSGPMSTVEFYQRRTACACSGNGDCCGPIGLCFLHKGSASWLKVEDRAAESECFAPPYAVILGCHTPRGTGHFLSVLHHFPSEALVCSFWSFCVCVCWEDGDEHQAPLVSCLAQGSNIRF